ncbi:MAG: glycosyltransferase family A protein [Patescibacteria group bacterium]
MERQKQPLVSVIIPVYTRAHLLHACLLSIAAQTYRNTQVIVVNDGSPESDEVKRIVAQHPEIDRYIEQENGGAPRARNRGFEVATGSYLLFCDADAVLEPTMIAQCMRALDQHPEAAYSYCGMKFGWKTFAALPFDATRLRLFNYIHVSSLIRREAFPGFDPEIKRFQDWDVWLTMLEKGHRGVAVPDVLFTVATKGTMSKWLPSWFYRLFPWSKDVRAYRAAQQHIRTKHHLRVGSGS